MAFFLSGQVSGSVEDRADGESQLDEASQGSDVAGGQHVSTTEQSAEEQENEKLDFVHEDEGTEDDAASTASSVSSVGRNSKG